MASVTELTIKLQGQDSVSGMLSGVKEKAGGLGGVLGGVLKVGALGAVAGIGALAGGLALCVKDAMEAQKVVAQTNAVLASTQGVSGMTAQSVSDLANTLSKVIPIDDELIQSTENMLLTFTAIGKDIFPQATETALDMATALGEDSVTAAMQLGKALNDPVAGVTALQRVGVKLTEQQKEQVKAMVEAGDVAGAQTVILKELQTEFGGSARAAGQTMAGQMKILGTAVGNVKEAIGTALLPILSKAAAGLSSFLIDHMDDIERFGTALAKLIGQGFGKLAEVFKTVSFYMGGLIGAFKEGDVTSDGLFGAFERAGVILRVNVVPALQAMGQVFQEKIIPFIQAAIPWLVDFGKTGLEIGRGIAQFLAPALDTLSDLWANLAPVLREYVLPVLKKVGEFLSEHKPLIIAAAAAILLLTNPWLAVAAAIVVVLAKWDEISMMFSVTIPGAIDSFLDKIGEIPIIGEIFKGTWDAVVLIVTAAWESIKIYVDTAIKAVKDIINIVMALIHGDFSTAWDGIKKLVSDVFEGIKSLVDVQLGLVKDLVFNQLETIKGVFSGAWNLIKDSVTGALQGAKDWVTEHWPEIATIISGPFAPIVVLATDGFGVRTALINVFTALPGQIGGALTSGVDLLATQITTFGTTAFAWFLSLPSKMLTLGVDIITGLWNGITSINIVAWVKGLAGDILQGVKDGLGDLMPGSPSQLGIDIGHGLGEGIAQGLTDTQAHIEGTLRLAGTELGQAVIAGFTTVVQAEANRTIAAILRDLAQAVKGARGGAGVGPVMGYGKELTALGVPAALVKDFITAIDNLRLGKGGMAEVTAASEAIKGSLSSEVAPKVGALQAPLTQTALGMSDMLYQIRNIVVSLLGSAVNRLDLLFDIRDLLRSVPVAQHGGAVLSGGLVHVEAGETIVPGQRALAPAPVYNITFTGPLLGDRMTAEKFAHWLEPYFIRRGELT